MCALWWIVNKQNTPEFVMHNCRFMMVVNDVFVPPLFLPAGMPQCDDC